MNPVSKPGTRDAGTPSPGSEELLEFLRTRRWFGDRANPVRAVRVRDAIRVEWPNSGKPYSVLRVDVDTERGTSTYQIFIERGANRLTDALDDGDFRRGLIDAFVQNLVFEDGGVRWRFRSEGRRALVAPPAAVIRVSTSEQSNSSVIVDGVAILKLFRRIEHGVHPDVEVTRFLTIDREFVHVPVLLGTIAFEDEHGEATAGMLQELVPGAVDGWSHVLRTLRDADDGRKRPHPPFVEDAEQLGVITRALHETLASGERGGAFERRAVGDDDLRAWTDQATNMVGRAVGSLRRASDAGIIPPHRRGRAIDAASVVRAADAFARGLADGVRQLGPDRGARTRTHGDYHLGQVIRSAAGQFLVIDFEGEPARPLSERRAHQSPLRDVAGMLRSFAYAAAVAGDGAAGNGWQRAVREAFLRGYFRDSAAGDHGILPASRPNADRLITLFETEKIFYELQYELDHRPDWVWIPLSGIAQLVT